MASGSAGSQSPGARRGLGCCQSRGGLQPLWAAGCGLRAASGSLQQGQAAPEVAAAGRAGPSSGVQPGAPERWWGKPSISPTLSLSLFGLHPPTRHP